VSTQDSIQPSSKQRPVTSNCDEWKAYWIASGQPWRCEPEIDIERQQYLTELYSITPNIREVIFPFKNVRLDRADVEWLLATHENGLGPVDWSDENQRTRQGIDLRGADLRKVDLQGLPLASLLGGLNGTEWAEATLEQRLLAAVHLEEANLEEAHLEGAILYSAHLEGANLREAHLEKAGLYRAHLEGAYLRYVHLGGAFLRKAFFDSSTSWDNAELQDAAFGCASITDIHWGDLRLSDVDWTQIKILGDEERAKQPIRWDGKPKTRDQQLKDYQRAMRANRQLAVVLREQGLNEEADRFAYRAQRLRRTTLRLQMLKPGISLWRRIRILFSLAFSLFLDLLAGFGYYPGRTLLWYLFVISTFSVIYSIVGSGHIHLFPDALTFSIMSFHGRGFFPNLSGETNLHDSLVVGAAFEAIIGLFIEISFIATFTQRFFGR
jgi:uncharacterized protein YjbI with pentapeptide repeats